MSPDSNYSDSEQLGDCVWLQQGAGPEAGRKDYKGRGQEFEVIEMFLIVLEISSVYTYIKIVR